MGTPLSQERIDDLESYVDGGAGMPVYTELVIAVDHPSLTKSLKLSISASPAAASVTFVGKLTGLSSRSVSKTFSPAYSSLPAIVAFRVYRNEETYTGSGKYRMKDVLYDHSSAVWLTVSGFTLDIDSSESLIGVIIDYKFETA